MCICSTSCPPLTCDREVRASWLGFQRSLRPCFCSPRSYTTASPPPPPADSLPATPGLAAVVALGPRALCLRLYEHPSFHRPPDTLTCASAAPSAPSLRSRRRHSSHAACPDHALGFAVNHGALLASSSPPRIHLHPRSAPLQNPC